MVLINLADGSTQTVDVSAVLGLSLASSLLASGKVTGLVLRQDGTQHALTMPRRFRSSVVYFVEQIRDQAGVVIGERIAVQADDVRLSLTATYASRMIRTDLVKTGSMRYAAR